MPHAQLNAYSVTLVLQLILAALWCFFFVLWLLGSEDQQHDQCLWSFVALSQLPGGAGSLRPAGNLDVQAYNLGGATSWAAFFEFSLRFEIILGFQKNLRFSQLRSWALGRRPAWVGSRAKDSSGLVTEWPTVSERDCRWRCPCCRCFCGLPCCNWSWLTLRAHWDKVKLHGRNFPAVFGQV